ncbi:hypothetical protein L9F63_022328, partial [Diploptera punctata]
NKELIHMCHNGLVAAAYLQKSGLQTCVLERRHVIGGAAVTEEIIPGFKFSRASYVLSLLRPYIYTDLNFKDNKHGLKVYPRNPSSYTPLIETEWQKGKPRSLTLGKDEENNWKQIAGFSIKDAESYKRYEKQLERIVNSIDPLLDTSVSEIMELFEAKGFWNKFLAFRRNPQLLKAVKSLGSLGADISVLYEFFTSPATHILSRWFESEPLKATLATDAVIGAMAAPHSPGSAYTLLHHCMGQIDGVRGSWGYPEGGMGTVTKALAAAATSYGAHVFTNVEVSEIRVNEDGIAVGVVTADGCEINAGVVLSNATPHITYKNLLPDGALPEQFKTAVSHINYTSPVTKINVALRELPNFRADPTVSEKRAMPHHQCTIHINCENMDLITQAYNGATDGYFSQRPMIEMVLPSSVDPTLAPPGCHVCLLFTQFTPYHLKDGDIWDDKKKQEYANVVFSNIEEYAPGFKESIIGMEVLSPPDLEQIFGLTGGNIFHGALSLDQLFLCRSTSQVCGVYPPYTPVKNLLLCGSGTHPGGGVMGAPGYIAAQTLIKNKPKTKHSH